jgi:hypothetical protein
MNLKLVVAICALAATPAIAQQPPPPGPKPTKAEAQQVVQSISSDKTKAATVCGLLAFDAQAAKLDPQKDQKKLEDLGKQAAALVQKVPEYDSFMMKLSQIDPASAEGKEFTAILDPLYKQCPR